MSARRRLASQRGAELIEFALVLPILLLVVLGIVDFGFVFQRLEIVTNAAREGARIRVLDTYTDADAQWRAWNYIVDSGLPTTGTDPTTGTTNPQITVSNVAVSIGGGNSINAKQVAVVYNSTYMFIGPIMRIFGANSLTSVPIRGTATMRPEIAIGGGS